MSAVTLQQEMELDLKLTAQKEARRRRILTGYARPAICSDCGDTSLWRMRNAAGEEILCDQWGGMHAPVCRRKP